MRYLEKYNNDEILRCGFTANRTTKVKEFAGCFIAMLLWLPTTFGGWLVYFNVMSMDNMWKVSLGLSVVVALLSSRA